MALKEDKAIREMLVSSTSATAQLLISHSSGEPRWVSSLDGVSETQTYEVNSSPWDFYFAPDAIDEDNKPIIPRSLHTYLKGDLLIPVIYYGGITLC